MNFEKSRDNVVISMQTCGRLLLSENSYLDQTGQNDFKHGKRRDVGYFMLVSVKEKTSN